MKKVTIGELKKDDVVIIYKDRGFVCYKLLHDPMFSKGSTTRYKAVKCSVKMDTIIKGDDRYRWTYRQRYFAPPEEHDNIERVNLRWKDILLIEEHDRI